MEAVSLIRAIAALVLVLGLIAAAAWAAKRYGAFRLAGLTRSRNQRLKIVEVLPIDARTKLVLVRQDAQEHLLVIGSGQSTAVSHNAAPQPDSPA
jgi:flagellar protein FliO/FliZ